LLVNTDSTLEESDSDCNTTTRDSCAASPGAHRKKRFRRLTDSLKCREFIGAERSADELANDDELPAV